MGTRPPYPFAIYGEESDLFGQVVKAAIVIGGPRGHIADPNPLGKFMNHLVDQSLKELDRLQPEIRGRHFVGAGGPSVPPMGLPFSPPATDKGEGTDGSQFARKELSCEQRIHPLQLASGIVDLGSRHAREESSRSQAPATRSGSPDRLRGWLHSASGARNTKGRGSSPRLFAGAGGTGSPPRKYL